MSEEHLVESARRFEGKVALVTGGSGRIGRSLVERLRLEGAAVEIADVSEPVPTDVSDGESVRSCIERTVTQYGHLDVVFSHAGLLRAGDIESMDEETFDEVVNVNLRGAFLVAKHSIPHLRESGGALVFTGSTAALAGSRGQGAYCAAKAGIVNLARALADELVDDGIRVNCVCPGWVDTSFNDSVWEEAGDRTSAEAELLKTVPMRRQAYPDEIVPAMLFLASDEASYVTGEVITVDGGLLATR